MLREGNFAGRGKQGLESRRKDVEGTNGLITRVDAVKVDEMNNLEMHLIAFAGATILYVFINCRETETH